MVALSEKNLEVEYRGQWHVFNFVWLRDNCQCRDCLHPDTRERIVITSDIADDIAPVKASLNGDALTVHWNQDSHRSDYRLNFLLEQQRQFNHDPAFYQHRPVAWGRELEGQIPTFDYQQLRASQPALLQWCMAVRDCGLTIVRNAPCRDGEIERFAEFVAVVRETIYDRLHQVRATPSDYNAYNVASTALELKPHTDMPNYNNPPGVQMFHFLVNDSVGGESTAVDGLHVANQLKQQNPAAFNVLANTPVEFRMFSAKGDVIASNPLLSLGSQGELKIFRFSNQLAQPSRLPVQDQQTFYDAYRALGRLIEAPENKVEFKLGSGDMMVTNNLRVMHGRNAYDPSSGDRHLQLSYMDYDDVLSRIRMLRNAGVEVAA